MRSGCQRALRSVEHERDPSRPDLEVLGTVVVHMLAAGDKTARFDCEVGHDAGATGFLGGRDEHRRRMVRPTYRLRWLSAATGISAQCSDSNATDAARKLG